MEEIYAQVDRETTIEQIIHDLKKELESQKRATVNSSHTSLDHGLGVKIQIQAISAIAKQTGELSQFIGILEKAVHLLQTDPHGWGDPQYRSKFVDGLFCQALVWPVVFRYVIYEQIRAVVLLNVEFFADFV